MQRGNRWLLALLVRSIIVRPPEMPHKYAQCYSATKDKQSDTPKEMPHSYHHTCKAQLPR